ncbi:MAG: hypothetical protein RR049_07395, partial [Angelakisella sp.]
VSGTSSKPNNIPHINAELTESNGWTPGMENTGGVDMEETVRPDEPGKIISDKSTEEERALMDRISGNMSMRNFSNDYVETPIVPTPRAAPAPVAAATAATTKDDVMNSFLQMDAQWQANRKMPAAYTARYRPKPQAQAPAKLSIGDKIKKLFRRFMRK